MHHYGTKRSWAERHTHKHTSFQQWKRKTFQLNAWPKHHNSFTLLLFPYNTEDRCTFFSHTSPFTCVPIRNIQSVKCHTKGFWRSSLKTNRINCLEKPALPEAHSDITISATAVWTAAVSHLCPQSPLLLAAKVISPWSKGQELPDYCLWQILCFENVIWCWFCNLLFSGRCQSTEM